MIHYTISAYQHTKPFLSYSLALLCCNNLMRCHTEGRIFIPAFCLMPDHLHLCLDGKEEKTKKFIAEWKSFITHESWKMGWSGKLWQAGALPKETIGPEGESAVIDYVLRNSQEAGLVSLLKEWPFWAEPRYDKKGWNDSCEAASGLANKTNE